MRSGRDNGETTATAVLVDGETTYRRASVVVEAARDAGIPLVLASPDAGNSRTFEPVADMVLRAIEGAPAPALVFIVVGEDEILSPIDVLQPIPRTCCASVACGYKILDVIPAPARVYFVLPGNAYSGLDVVALLCSGATGVLDVKALGVSEVLRLVNCSRTRGRQDPGSLLVGRPYDRLMAFRQLAQAYWRRVPRQFELLAALAEIPLLSLPLAKSGQKPSGADVGRALEQWEHLTNAFGVASLMKDKPRAIRNEVLTLLEVQDLAQQPQPLWSSPYGNEGEPDLDAHIRHFMGAVQTYELPLLPLYARSLGFPSRLLPIRGIQDHQLSRALFRGAMEIYLSEGLAPAEGLRMAYFELPQLP